MTERMKETFDAQAKIQELITQIGATGMRTAKLPSMVFDVLRNLVKGRVKINFGSQATTTCLKASTH